MTDRTTRKPTGEMGPPAKREPEESLGRGPTICQETPTRHKRPNGLSSSGPHILRVWAPPAGFRLWFLTLPPEGAPSQHVSQSAGLAGHPAGGQEKGVVFMNLNDQNIKDFYWIKMHPLQGEGNTTIFPHYRVLNKHCCCFIPWGHSPVPVWVGHFHFPDLKV